MRLSVGVPDWWRADRWRFKDDSSSISIVRVGFQSETLISFLTQKVTSSFLPGNPISGAESAFGIRFRLDFAGTAQKDLF